MICSATLCNVSAMADFGDTPETASDRLALARKRAGYDDKTEFAKAVGIHPTTYRAYENGQNGFAKLAPTFAKKLGVSVGWLLDGTDEATAPAVQVARPVTRAVQSDLPPIRNAIDGSVKLRQVDLGLSMGDGSNIDDIVEEGEVEFDAHLLSTITRSPPERLLVARGDGDSMWPTIINNDMIVIDTGQRQLTLDDRIWACSVHGAGNVKRLRVVARDRVEVRSDNATVGNREVHVDDLAILGRVIWIGRRV